MKQIIVYLVKKIYRLKAQILFHFVANKLENQCFIQYVDFGYFLHIMIIIEEKYCKIIDKNDFKKIKINQRSDVMGVKGVKALF